MDDPIYVFHLATLRPSGDLIKTSVLVADDFMEIVADVPTLAEAVRAQARATTKAMIDRERPGQSIEFEEWWIGDDAPNAFIRNREPKRLDW